MRGGNGHVRYEPPSEILHSLIFKYFRERPIFMSNPAHVGGQEMFFRHD